MKKALWLLPVIFLGLLWLLFQSLGRDPHELPSAVIGQSLPAFDLPSLDGKSRHTEQQLVGPALLNVWATWCPTCLQEHAMLLKLAQQGVVIYGVNYKDDAQAAQALLRESGNPYRLLIADPQGSFGIDLGVYGAPETFVIDAKGKIRYRLSGALTEQNWRETLQPLLTGGTP